jgi:plasmid segregation protein ParM
MSKSKFSKRKEVIPQKEVVRAIDLGYGNTKYIVTDDRECGIFPSLARPALQICMGDEHLSSTITTRVLVDDQEYLVGPDPDPTRSYPQLHTNYIETPLYRACLHAALAKMQLPKIDLLVVGLPVSLYQSHSARLKAMIIGTHQVQPGVFVEVTNCFVIAQPLGGFVYQAISTEYMSDNKPKRALLVDAGYYTFDWMVADGFNQIVKYSGSCMLGMSQYIYRLQRALSDQFQLNDPMMATDISRSLRGAPFERLGSTIDLSPFMQVANSTVQEAVREMQMNVMSSTSFNDIFITGGGANHYHEVIQQAFPKLRVTVMTDPLYANVRGFMMLGQTSVKQLPPQQHQAA